jgi:hypothetical protein
MSTLDRQLTLHVRTDGAVVAVVYVHGQPISRGVFHLGWEYLLGPSASIKHSLIYRALKDWDGLDYRFTVTFDA